MAHLKITEQRTSPVRSQILPSPILLKEVTATKNPCSLDAFLMVEMLIKWRITALWRPSHQLVGWNQNAPLHFNLEKYHCSQEERKLICYSRPQSRGQASCIFNISRSEYNISLSKRDFLVLLYCNTQSYCIRERFVSLSYFWISIKVTLFSVFLHVLTFFFLIENQTSRSDYLWFARNITF